MNSSSLRQIAASLSIVSVGQNRSPIYRWMPASLISRRFGQPTAAAPWNNEKTICVFLERSL
jgi:hypothetical protein